MAKKVTKKQTKAAAAVTKKVTKKKSSSIKKNNKEIREMSIQSIEPSPLNRKINEDENLKALALSMEDRGLIQPITVRSLGRKKYEIVVGERRWRAAKSLGWEKIHAIVVKMDTEEAHADRLVENLQREDVPPLEQSEGVAYLLEQHGHNVTEVAKRLGVSEEWVYIRSRLSNLSKRWRNELSDPETSYERIAMYVTYQEEVAKLPKSTQDRLLDQGVFTYCASIESLRKRIGEQMHLVLLAPWPEDVEKKLPPKGRCKNCTKRSDASGNMPLFCDPETMHHNAPHCLDPECWDRKIKLWITGVIEAARRKDKDARCIIEGYPSIAERNKLEENFGKIWPQWAYKIDANLSDDERNDEDFIKSHEKHLAVYVYGEQRGEIVVAWFEIGSEDEEEETISQEEIEARRAKEKAEFAAKIKKSERIFAIYKCISKFLGNVDENNDLKNITMPPPDSDNKLLRLIAAFGYRETFTDNFILCHPEKLRSEIWHTLVEDMFYDLNSQFIIDSLDSIKKSLEFADLLIGRDGRIACESALAEHDKAVKETDQ